MAATVHVLPIDQELVTEEGETLLDAAVRAGWKWPTVCNGDGVCGICYVRVESGAEHLSPMATAERDRIALTMAAGDPTARLACQIRVSSGTVRVHRRGAKPRPPTHT